MNQITYLPVDNPLACLLQYLLITPHLLQFFCPRPNCNVPESFPKISNVLSCCFWQPYLFTWSRTPPTWFPGDSYSYCFRLYHWHTYFQRVPSGISSATVPKNHRPPSGPLHVPHWSRIYHTQSLQFSNIPPIWHSITGAYLSYNFYPQELYKWRDHNLYIFVSFKHLIWEAYLRSNLWSQCISNFWVLKIFTPILKVSISLTLTRATW